MSNMSEKNEDHLTVDKPIPGQNYVCMSFVSPEKLVKNKQVFFVQNFLKDLVTKLNLSSNLNLEYQNVLNDYENFMFNNKTALEKEYHEQNNYQPTIRGIKIRGVYDTFKEAEIRSKVLQKIDKSFNVYVGPLGYWLPWDPDQADEKDLDQQYQLNELNSLVNEYKNNEIKTNEYYADQTQERSQRAKDQIDDIIGIDGIFTKQNISTNNVTNNESNENESNENESNEVENSM